MMVDVLYVGCLGIGVVVSSHLCADGMVAQPITDQNQNQHNMLARVTSNNDSKYNQSCHQLIIHDILA